MLFFDRSDSSDLYLSVLVEWFRASFAHRAMLSSKALNGIATGVPR